MMNKKKIHCFGEMLWDLVFENKYPGGAPLNVAYHLAKFQADITLISRIGKDAEGEELKNLVDSWGIQSDLIQVDDQAASGKVHAVLLENGEVEYDIRQGVAWDYIELSYPLTAAVRQSDCFIYGSLSARNVQSRKTLIALLEEATFNVFDVNLRYPHYEAHTLELLLGQANLLKINQHELVEVTKLLGLSTADEEERLVKNLMNRFAIEQVIVTKGKRGAWFYSGSTKIFQGAKDVDVQDTIGCGDAFLAAFLWGYLHDEPVEVSLKKAVAMGSFIASKTGGCPSYDLLEYDNFVSEIMLS